MARGVQVIEPTKCPLCGCILLYGKFEFTGHNPETCQTWTKVRIRDLEQALQNQILETARLRDMIARHECKVD